MLNEREKRLAPIFDRAMRLRDDGQLRDAHDVLHSLLEQLEPGDKVLFPYSHMQLGHIAKQLGDHAQREPHFRAAVAASPNHETASVSLFLALFDRGQWIEAHQEMVRLLRRRYSKQYDDMLTPNYGISFRGELRQLLHEARALLAKRLARKLRIN